MCRFEGFFQTVSMETVIWALQHYLEVVHQAVLTASLFADGEVVPQHAGSVGAVDRVADRVVVVACGVSEHAGA